ncbi:conserved hypothetical protein, partial [Trichinella spiralis]
MGIMCIIIEIKKRPIRTSTFPSGGGNLQPTGRVWREVLGNFCARFS